MLRSFRQHLGNRYVHRIQSVRCRHHVLTLTNKKIAFLFTNTKKMYFRVKCK